LEALGPAERIVQALTRFSDHIVHNRPGIVTPDARHNIGVRWEPATYVAEDEGKVAYRIVNKKKVRAGLLGDDMKVRKGGRVVGEFRASGLFPEAVVYLYRQIADVWEMDNEFAARWASWSFPREHRDLKVVLAAFLLVQTRSGEPVREDGEVIFLDDDFRAVGEAMVLGQAKHDINPKLLLRIGEVLELDGVAAINRELGFGKSARRPAIGRYYKAVEKWLAYREANPRVLKGAIKAGFTTTIRQLARKVGYKPSNPAFFAALKWHQKQSQDGRRQVAIGDRLAKGEDWAELSEEAICERIVESKASYKQVVGRLKGRGITRAIMAAVIESGGLSNQDLIILTPTLEEMGLLKVESIKARWDAANANAENQRAANIARRVKSKEAKEGLQKAEDVATAKAIREVTRELRVYFIVDISSSMQGGLERAKTYLKRFLGGFPLDRLHVSVFNTVARVVEVKVGSAAGVEHAFRGYRAGGCTDYSAGVKALVQFQPKPGEDALMMFVGDQEDNGVDRLVRAVQDSGINPVAFGLLHVLGDWARGRGGYAARYDNTVVEQTAARLGIPCFKIDEEMFEGDDPYVVTRTLSNLIASTPVGEPVAGREAPRRKTLVQEILETELLVKPAWAA
jgi:hypothetical protein